MCISFPLLRRSVSDVYIILQKNEILTKTCVNYFFGKNMFLFDLIKKYLCLNKNNKVMFKKYQSDFASLVELNKSQLHHASDRKRYEKRMSKTTTTYTTQAVLLNVATLYSGAIHLVPKYRSYLFEDFKFGDDRVICAFQSVVIVKLALECRPSMKHL